MRRITVLVETVDYVQRAFTRKLAKTEFSRGIEHYGNVEKYLTFNEHNIDIIIIPYLAHYPRIFYDNLFRLVSHNISFLYLCQLDSDPSDEGFVDDLFKLFLPLARYEPSLIYTTTLEPDVCSFRFSSINLSFQLPRVKELQEERKKWCWDYMKRTVRIQWVHPFIPV